MKYGIQDMPRGEPAERLFEYNNQMSRHIADRHAPQAESLRTSEKIPSAMRDVRGGTNIPLRTRQ